MCIVCREIPPMIGERFCETCITGLLPSGQQPRSFDSTQATPDAPP